jgi:hypothetical protein
VKARHEGCTWHHCRGCVEVKLKTDGSMRWATSDPATLALLFSLYYALGAVLSFSLLLGPINRTLEGWGSLPLLQVSFAFLE